MASRAVKTAPDPVDLDQDSRYKDFDEARKSLKEIRFRMRGKLYTCPPEIPVSLILDEVIATEQGDIAAGLMLIKKVIGLKNYDQMIGDGLSPTDLTRLVRWITAEYGLNMGVEEEKESGSPT